MLLQAASGARLFAAVYGVLLYKLVFWSDRTVAWGTLLAIFLLATCCTVLLTTDLHGLWGEASFGVSSAVRAVHDVARTLESFWTGQKQGVPYSEF